MKQYFPFLLALSLLLCPGAFAQIQQTIEISSSPNPVGSGARAIGMGGAFIGVADDATAASWNPGGLIQLETPEVSLVGAWNSRREDTTYQAFPEASGPQTVQTTELNYLSAAYPFQAWGRNMIVSLNYQHLYDFNTRASYKYSVVETTPPALTMTNAVDYDKEGALKAVSPAFAVQLTPQFSLGITLNIWAHGLFDNKWSSRYQSSGGGTIGATAFTVGTRIDESYTMNGMSIRLFDPFHWENLNANIGVMWNIDSRFTLGAVLKTPFDASFDRKYRYTSQIVFSGIGPTAPMLISESGTNVATMPMSVGTGLAYRASDALTVDVDVYWTQWSKYILYDSDGNKSNPITGKPDGQTTVQDTVQLRLGGEYLFIGARYVVPVRAGVFYDPEPSEGSPDNFFGCSFGSGIAFGSWIFDAAYQYRFGRDVRSVMVGSEDSSQDVDQHSVYTSLVYHF